MISIRLIVLFAALFMMSLTTAAWQFERAARLKVEDHLASTEQQLDAQKGTMQSQVQTISRCTEFQNQNAMLIDSLREENEQAQLKAFEAEKEVLKIRASEREASLTSPYARGEYAFDRERDLLMRFTGQSGGGEDSSGDEDHSGGAGSSDST